MTDNTLDLAKKLLLSACQLEQLGLEHEDPRLKAHAELLRETALHLKQLQEQQAQFSIEDSGLLHKLNQQEILSLRPGASLYVVHRKKGRWTDCLDKVLSFLYMHDLMLASGTVLPMEEFDTVWWAYLLEEPSAAQQTPGTDS